jgi:hypothetical protein
MDTGASESTLWIDARSRTNRKPIMLEFVR